MKHKILIVTLSFMIIKCSSGPSIDEINSAKNKYFQYNAIFSDTLINYEIKGDSIILEFVNPPSTELWYVSLAYPNSIMTEHEQKKIKDNKIIIFNENLSELNDSITMQIFLYPGNGVVYTEEIYHEPYWFLRYSIKSNEKLKGKFSFVNIKNKMWRVNLNFLKEIESKEMRKILTDTLLNILPYEVIKGKEPNYLKYIDEIKNDD